MERGGKAEREQLCAKKGTKTTVKEKGEHQRGKRD